MRVEEILKSERLRSRDPGIGDPGGNKGTVLKWTFIKDRVNIKLEHSSLTTKLLDS